MSNEKKAIAKVSVDEESGVIMARAALPAELEARRKDLLDPAAIGAARDVLDNFEDRLNHLNSMSNLFDDDDGDGDALISMGGAVTRIEEPSAPARAPVAGSGQPDIYEDEADQVDEAVIIGGLASLDDDMMDEDFIQADDDLLSSFDDEDPLDFGEAAFETSAADPMLAAAPGSDSGDIFAPQAGIASGEVDFVPADDDEIARNARASQIAIEIGEDLNEVGEQFDFEEESENLSGISEDFDGADELDADLVRIESPVIGTDVTQSLGSMVGRRRDRHDTDAGEIAIKDISAATAEAPGIDPVEEEDVGDLWASADPEDGFTGSWGEDPDAGEEQIFFKDDFAEFEDANNDPADTDWGFHEESDAAQGEDAGSPDEFEPGSSMADPTPWSGFGDDTDVPGASDYDARAPEEDQGGWGEDDTDFSAVSEDTVPGGGSNYNYADENDVTALNINAAADRVSAKRESSRDAAPKADAAAESFDDSWVSAGEDEVAGDEPADAPDMTDDEAEQPVAPAMGKKNLGFIATSAAVVALIAGAGYFGAASMGLIGGGQPQSAASFPIATPVEQDLTPAAPAIPAPVFELEGPAEIAPVGAAPAEAAPVAADIPEDSVTPENGDSMPGLDLFDPEAPIDAEPAPVESEMSDPAPDESEMSDPAQDESEMSDPAPDESEMSDPAPDEGDLSDLVMDTIPEPAGIDTPVTPVDEAADGLESIARGLTGAADGNLDSLFLTDSSTPLEAEEAPAFDPAMVTDLLVDYATKTDTDELRAAIDLMFEKVNTISEEVTERDERILELEERVVSASEKAARAETLALAQNEVLVEFVRVKEKVDMAESLIVDLSRRISSMETTDPADRVAVERSLEDIMSRMDSLARDVGLVARVAINGTPEKVRAGAAAGDAGVPGSSSVYESTSSTAAAPGDVGKVPSNVEVGDFVEGYGYVLQIMPTSDGSRVVVMENKSVLLPN